MVFFSKKHLYPFSWEKVVNAFWNKYPNDLQSHVRRVDIINIYFDEKDKILYTKRLFSLKYNLPKLLERIIGSSLSGLAIEESKCDFNEKRLISNGTNHSFNNFFLIRETCGFSSNNECPESTLYMQNMAFKLFGEKNKINRMNKLFESTVVNLLNEKSQSGIKAMYNKIDQIKSMLNNKYEIKGSENKSTSYKLNGLSKTFEKKSLKFFEKINKILIVPYKVIFHNKN
ncbi:PRELI/MSF1 domain containing protein [Cryptosporidium tyzzeri]|nr:PRELI/MSF1 domain containing protein [Cryptosporidium tyzzeri]